MSNGEIGDHLALWAGCSTVAACSPARCLSPCLRTKQITPPCALGWASMSLSTPVADVEIGDHLLHPTRESELLNTDLRPCGPDLQHWCRDARYWRQDPRFWCPDLRSRAPELQLCAWDLQLPRPDLQLPGPLLHIRDAPLQLPVTPEQVRDAPLQVRDVLPQVPAVLLRVRGPLWPVPGANLRLRSPNRQLLSWELQKSGEVSG